MQAVACTIFHKQSVSVYIIFYRQYTVQMYYIELYLIIYVFRELGTDVALLDVTWHLLPHQ